MTAATTIVSGATRAHPGVGTGRLVQLEGLRGLAAMMVVAWHFVWAFAPWELGSVAGLPSPGVIGSPVAASIDGPAAVALFFVLSGFVLPLGFFRSGRTRIVMHAAAKRWFRLVGLSVIAVLLSYACFRFGLYHYQEAGRLSGSDWLATYGGGDRHAAFAPSLTGALGEGVAGAFLFKSDSYNPVLWTMHHELLGSFLSLGTGLAIWRASMPVRGCILALGAALSLVLDPWLMPFLVGTGLAFLVSKHKVRLRLGTALASIATGLFLFGYLEPQGAYAGFPVLLDSAGYRQDRILVHTLSALLIMLGLIGNDRASQALTTKPLLLLGRLSFPIYLFHFPLMCSIACGLFLVFQNGTPYWAILALVAAIYLPVVLMTGALFARVDEVWATWVNRGTDRLMAWCARLLRGVRAARVHPPA